MAKYMTDDKGDIFSLEVDEATGQQQWKPAKVMEQEGKKYALLADKWEPIDSPAIAKPNAAAETIKALPKAFKAGSLAAGLAGVKAYQAIGGPKDIGVDINKQLAYAPEVIGRAVGGLKRDIGQAFGKQQPSSRYDPKSPRMRELEDIEKQQAEKAVQRFKSTKDITDFYEKEIEGIKSKYKENLITKTAESLPLSLSGLVATMANPALGAAYTGYVFGGSSSQDLLDKAFAEERKKPENKGLDDAKLRARVNDAYKMYAAVSGAVQAGGEYAGNILLSKLIPGANPIKNKIIKGITTALGGGVEEAVTETGQEAGSILAEKAAGLDTTGAGARLWDSFSVGGLSGLFLGGLGGAAFRGDTIADVKQAVNNPTPETKAKAGESIYKEWKAKSPDEKQLFLNKLTPEARKIFTEGISQAETKAKQAEAKATEAEAKVGELEIKNATAPLTGKLSRSGWQEGLKSRGIKSYAERRKAGETILYADLDNFKAGVNDPYGDKAGDNAIKFAADIAGEVAQKYGLTHSTPMGDENLLSVPAGLDANSIAEELRQKMEANPFIAPDGKPVKLTFSIGVGKPGGLEDDANYAAKYAKYKGRNTVATIDEFNALSPEIKADMKARAEKGRILDSQKAGLPLQSADFKQTQAQVMEKVKADLAMTDEEIVDLITNEAKDGAMLRTLVEGGVAQGKDIDGIAKDMGRYVKAIKNAAQPETAVETAPAKDLTTEAKKYKTAEEFVKAQGREIYHATDSEPFDVFDIGKAKKGELYFNPLGTGQYLSSNKEFVKKFGNNVMEYVLPKNAKTKIITIDSWAKKEYPVIIKNTLKKMGIRYDDLTLGEKAMLGEQVPDAPIISLNNAAVLLGDISERMGKKGDIQKAMEQVSDARNANYDAIIFRDTDSSFNADEILIPKPSIIKTRTQLTDIWNKANTPSTPEAPTPPAKDGISVGETIYHRTTKKLKNGVDFPAFYGTKEFSDTYKDDFGPNVYELKITPEMKAKMVDLNDGSKKSLQVMADMAQKAFPNDEEFYNQLLAGDKRAIDDFYSEVWVDRNNIQEGLKKNGLVGAKYQEEYFINPTSPIPTPPAKATPAEAEPKPDLRPAKVMKVGAKDLEMFEGLVEGNRNAGVQPGGLIRDDNGRVINRYGPTSTYSPEWRAMFGREGSVKGVGKDEVIRILKKLKANEPLTARQQTAYEQIIEALKDFASRAPEIAIADDLNPGDSFMKAGEKHTVKEITEDGKVKIQNGTTEYLNPGETIEIDRGTLEKKGREDIEPEEPRYNVYGPMATSSKKWMVTIDGMLDKKQFDHKADAVKYAEAKTSQTIFEKTDAGDQSVIDGMAGREMPRGPIKQKPSAKSDRGTIFDQEGLKTDREIQGERGQAELYAGLPLTDMLIRATTKQQRESAYAKLINRFAPIENAMKEARKQGAEGMDIGIRAREYLGIAGKYQATLNDKTFRITKDGKIKDTGEGLRPILQDYEKINPQDQDLTDMSQYMQARRAIADKRGVVTLPDGKNANEAMTELRQKYGDKLDEFSEIAERVYAFQDRVLHQLVDAGIISEEKYKAIKDNNPDYIPFDRVFEEEGFVGGPKSRQLFTDARSPLKTIKGSKRETENSFESILKNTFQILDRAERNTVAKGLADIAKFLPERVKKLNQAMDVKVTDQLDLEGNPVKIIEKKAGRYFYVENGDRKYIDIGLSKPKGVIEYYENGDKKYLKLDENLYNAMSGLNDSQVGDLVKIISQPTKWLRTGVVISPEFWVRNSIRDQFTAFLQTDFNPKIIFDTMGAIADIMKKSDTYHDWLKTGGAYSGFVDINRENLRQKLAEVKKNPNLLLKLNVLQTAQDISGIVENATRVGIYKRALKRGDTPVEAGFKSREGTLDFARRGSAMKEVNSLIAFFNPSIQGTDKFIRTMKEKPTETTLKAVASITIPSMMLWAINKDDEEYQEMSPWLKDLFWNFKVNGTWVRIPKPYLYGQLFGSSVERMLDRFYRDDPEAMDGFAKSMMDAVSPVQGDPASTLLPTAIRPLVENATNWSFFREAPVVTKSRAGLIKSEQYTGGTTETAKAIGKLLDYSPAKIENIVRGWGGTTAYDALKLSDAIYGWTGGKKKEQRPVGIAGKYFVKGFTSKPPLINPKSGTQFYDNWTALDSEYKTYNKMVKEGRLEDANKLAGKYADIDAVHKMVLQAKNKIKEIDDELDLAEKGKRPDAEKLAIIEPLEKQRLAIYKAANDLMKKRTDTIPEEYRKMPKAETSLAPKLPKLPTIKLY